MSHFRTFGLQGKVENQNFPLFSRAEEIVQKQIGLNSRDVFCSKDVSTEIRKKISLLEKMEN